MHRSGRHDCFTEVWCNISYNYKQNNNGFSFVSSAMLENEWYWSCQLIDNTFFIACRCKCSKLHNTYQSKKLTNRNLEIYGLCRVACVIILLTAVVCDTPRRLANATYQQSGDTYESETVYSCLPGFWFQRDVISITVTCLASGLWNDTAILGCTGETHIQFC